MAKIAGLRFTATGDDELPHGVLVHSAAPPTTSTTSQYVRRVRHAGAGGTDDDVVLEGDDEARPLSLSMKGGDASTSADASSSRIPATERKTDEPEGSTPKSPTNMGIGGGSGGVGGKPGYGGGDTRQPISRRPRQGLTTLSFDSGEVERLRSFMDTENQRMQEIASDPYYKFAKVAESKAGVNPERGQSYIMDEYREYMKQYGRLHASPLQKVSKIVKALTSAMMRESTINNYGGTIDQNVPNLTDTLLDEFESALAFMREREGLHARVHRAANAGRLTGRSMYTPEFNAMIDNGIVMLGLEIPQGRLVFDADELIGSPELSVLFAEFIVLDKLRSEVANNRGRSRLQADYGRILHQRELIKNILVSRQREAGLGVALDYAGPYAAASSNLYNV